MQNLKEFEGRKFSFGMIPPMEAIGVEVSIVGVIGEPLFRALMIAGNKEKVAAMSKQEQDKLGADVVGMAIGLLASRLDAEELKKTIRIVFKYVGTSESVSIAETIDQVFMGKNRQLWEVFIYALRFNFTDFFPESLLASVRSKLPKLL
jgi:hypothetical protein